MITLITIEQVSDAHGALIVDAFNKFFILNGGEKNGNGHGTGDGWGNGYGWGWGDGGGAGNAAPEEWFIK